MLFCQIILACLAFLITIISKSPSSLDGSNVHTIRRRFLKSFTTKTSISDRLVFKTSPAELIKLQAELQRILLVNQSIPKHVQQTDQTIMRNHIEIISQINFDDGSESIDTIYKGFFKPGIIEFALYRHQSALQTYRLPDKDIKCTLNLALAPIELQCDSKFIFKRVFRETRSKSKEGKYRKSKTPYSFIGTQGRRCGCCSNDGQDTLNSHECTSAQKCHRRAITGKSEDKENIIKVKQCKDQTQKDYSLHLRRQDDFGNNEQVRSHETSFKKYRVAQKRTDQNGGIKLEKSIYTRKPATAKNKRSNFTDSSMLKDKANKQISQKVKSSLHLIHNPIINHKQSNLQNLVACKQNASKGEIKKSMREQNKLQNVKRKYNIPGQSLKRSLKKLKQKHNEGQLASTVSRPEKNIEKDIQFSDQNTKQQIRQTKTSTFDKFKITKKPAIANNFKSQINEPISASTSLSHVPSIKKQNFPVFKTQIRDRDKVDKNSIDMQHTNKPASMIPTREGPNSKVILEKTQREHLQKQQRQNQPRRAEEESLINSAKTIKFIERKNIFQETCQIPQQSVIPGAITNMNDIKINSFPQPQNDNYIVPQDKQTITKSSHKLVNIHNEDLLFRPQDSIKRPPSLLNLSALSQRQGNIATLERADNNKSIKQQNNKKHLKNQSSIQNIIKPLSKRKEDNCENGQFIIQDQQNNNDVCKGHVTEQDKIIGSCTISQRNQASNNRRSSDIVPENLDITNLDEELRSVGVELIYYSKKNITNQSVEYENIQKDFTNKQSNQKGLNYSETLLSHKDQLQFQGSNKIFPERDANDCEAIVSSKQPISYQLNSSQSKIKKNTDNLIDSSKHSLGQEDGKRKSQGTIHECNMVQSGKYMSNSQCKDEQNEVMKLATTSASKINEADNLIIAQCNNCAPLTKETNGKLPPSTIQQDIVQSYCNQIFTKTDQNTNKQINQRVIQETDFHKVANQQIQRNREEEKGQQTKKQIQKKSSTLQESQLCTQKNKSPDQIPCQTYTETYGCSLQQEKSIISCQQIITDTHKETNEKQCQQTKEQQSIQLNLGHNRQIINNQTIISGSQTQKSVQFSNKMTQKSKTYLVGSSISNLDHQRMKTPMTQRSKQKLSKSGSKLRSQAKIPANTVYNETINTQIKQRDRLGIEEIYQPVSRNKLKSKSMKKITTFGSQKQFAKEESRSKPNNSTKAKSLKKIQNQKSYKVISSARQIPAKEFDNKSKQLGQEEKQDEKTLNLLLQTSPEQKLVEIETHTKNKQVSSKIINSANNKESCGQQQTIPINILGIANEINVKQQGTNGQSKFQSQLDQQVNQTTKQKQNQQQQSQTKSKSINSHGCLKKHDERVGMNHLNSELSLLEQSGIIGDNCLDHPSSITAGKSVRFFDQEANDYTNDILSNSRKNITPLVTLRSNASIKQQLEPHISQKKQNTIQKILNQQEKGVQDIEEGNNKDLSRSKKSSIFFEQRLVLVQPSEKIQQTNKNKLSSQQMQNHLFNVSSPTQEVSTGNKSNSLKQIKQNGRLRDDLKSSSKQVELKTPLINQQNQDLKEKGILDLEKQKQFVSKDNDYMKQVCSKLENNGEQNYQALKQIQIKSQVKGESSLAQVKKNFSSEQKNVGQIKIDQIINNERKTSILEVKEIPKNIADDQVNETMIQNIKNSTKTPVEQPLVKQEQYQSDNEKINLQKELNSGHRKETSILMNKDVQTDEACGLTQKYRNDTSKIDHKFASSDQCISNSSNPLTSFKKSKSVDQDEIVKRDFGQDIKENQLVRQSKQLTSEQKILLNAKKNVGGQQNYNCSFNFYFPQKNQQIQTIAQAQKDEGSVFTEYSKNLMKENKSNNPVRQQSKSKKNVSWDIDAERTSNKNLFDFMDRINEDIVHQHPKIINQIIFVSLDEISIVEEHPPMKVNSHIKEVIKNAIDFIQHFLPNFIVNKLCNIQSTEVCLFLTGGWTILKVQSIANKFEIIQDMMARYCKEECRVIDCIEMLTGAPYRTLKDKQHDRQEGKHKPGYRLAKSIKGLLSTARELAHYEKILYLLAKPSQSAGVVNKVKNYQTPINKSKECILECSTFTRNSSISTNLSSKSIGKSLEQHNFNVQCSHTPAYFVLSLSDSLQYKNIVVDPSTINTYELFLGDVVIYLKCRYRMLLYREYSKDKYELMSESWKWLKFHCREKGVYLLILEPMPMVSEGKSKEIKKGEEKLTIRYGLARGMGKTWVDRIMALSQDRGRSANGGYENNKNIYLPVCRQSCEANEELPDDL